jgi:hypothetical protein
MNVDLYSLHMKGVMMTCSCVVIKGRMGAAADLQDPGDQLHPHLHAASRQTEHSSTYHVFHQIL